MTDSKQISGTDDAPGLPAERKREILELEGKLPAGNLFALLGVDNGASAEECKRAYYDLSMRLHPDRFYGKDLGTFRARIDALFHRLTEAQTTLTDREKRQAFQNAHPELFRKVEAPSTHDAVRAEDRARRIARHPYLAKQARQFELLGRARKALEAGQAAAAILDLEQLLKIEPGNSEAKVLLADATQKKGALRAQQAYDDGVKVASIGDYAGAVRAFLEALEKSPTREAAMKGYDAAMSANDLKSAKVFAQKWIEFEPRSPRAHLALAEILDRAGLPKNARREAEEALRLDPENKTAKALCVKLRWA